MIHRDCGMMHRYMMYYVLVCDYSILTSWNWKSFTLKLINTMPRILVFQRHVHQWTGGANRSRLSTQAIEAESPIQAGVWQYCSNTRRGLLVKKYNMASFSNIQCCKLLLIKCCTYTVVLLTKSRMSMHERQKVKCRSVGMQAASVTTGKMRGKVQKLPCTAR